jgi:hypothetical protein
MYVQNNLADVISRQLNSLKNTYLMLVLNFGFMLVVFLYLHLVSSR